MGKEEKLTRMSGVFKDSQGTTRFGGTKSNFPSLTLFAEHGGVSKSSSTGTGGKGIDACSPRITCVVREVGIVPIEMADASFWEGIGADEQNGVAEPCAV